MTADEMFEVYIGEINDYLPYEYVEKVKNSLQYKEFVKSVKQNIKCQKPNNMEDTSNE